jgi:hypothetical protein
MILAYFGGINLPLENCAGVTSQAKVANSVNAAFTSAARVQGAPAGPLEASEIPGRDPAGRCGVVRLRLCKELQTRKTEI